MQSPQSESTPRRLTLASPQRTAENHVLNSHSTVHSLLWDQIKNAEWGRSSQFSVKIMNGNLEVGHLGNFPKERERQFKREI